MMFSKKKILLILYIRQRGCLFHEIGNLSNDFTESVIARIYCNIFIKNNIHILHADY